MVGSAVITSPNEIWNIRIAPEVVFWTFVMTRSNDLSRDLRSSDGGHLRCVKGELHSWATVDDARIGRDTFRFFMPQTALLLDAAEVPSL